jgi:hypothetical protein
MSAAFSNDDAEEFFPTAGAALDQEGPELLAEDYEEQRDGPVGLPGIAEAYRCAGVGGRGHEVLLDSQFRDRRIGIFL